MRVQVRKLVGITILSIAVAVAAGPAQAAVPTTTASPGPSPFNGCTADDVPGQIAAFPGSFVNTNSEMEPFMAINPADPANLIGGFQQDRWSNGGARGTAASYSTDGGATWHRAPVPGVSDCAGGDTQRATDPWVSFSPDGTAYFFTLSFDGIGFENGLYVNKSTDGGRTWGPRAELLREGLATTFNDKNAITADPYDSRFVYAVWDRLVFPQERADDQAAFHAFASRGPTVLARTVNGGQSWEPMRTIYDPGENDQTIGNIIEVLPDGTLACFFDEFRNDNKHGTRGDSLRVIFSHDHGGTWSSPTFITDVQQISVVDPDTGQGLRTGGLPDVAVDRDSGALYVVWQDSRFSGGAVDDIAMVKSTDGGHTWSAPIQVNHSAAAFTPMVEVADDGTVGISFYDLRNNTATAPLDTDYWLARCRGACASTAAFSETRVTATSFDIRNAAKVTGGRPFLGDYEGLAHDGDDFLVYFAQAFTAADPSSIVFGRITP